MVWWRPWEQPEIAIEVVKFGATEVELAILIMAIPSLNTPGRSPSERAAVDADKINI
jgi:hypothetical protein